MHIFFSLPDVNETIATNNIYRQQESAPVTSGFYTKQKTEVPMNSSQLYPSQNLRSATPNLVNSHYYSSQNLSPAPLNVLPSTAQIATNQYASEPFLQQSAYIRARSPTALDYSVHLSDGNSTDTRNACDPSERPSLSSHRRI